MDLKELEKKFETFGVIPVIAIEEPENALHLADSLIEGGLPVAEITFRTKAAAEVIETLRKNRPELMVGAGTILTVEDLLRARDSGAVFGVAPGYNPLVVSKAKEIGFHFFPGVMTPSEIDRGVAEGFKILKFFPSEAAGGINMLKAVSAPYAHLGVRYIPTGGVNASNLSSYLEFDRVIAVGGTWVAKKDAISRGDWEKIKNTVKEAVDIIKRVRGKSS